MNPDQALIHSIRQGRALPVALDSNPFARELCAEVLDLPQDGGITLGFDFGERFTQGRGVVQGGVVASGLDFALGLAPFTLLAPGMTLATTNLTVSFLRPVPPGRVRVIAQVDRAGTSAGFTSGRMLDMQGRVVATGMAALSIFPDRPKGS